MDRRDAIIAGAGLGLGGLMAARPDQQYYPAQGGQQIPGSRTGKIRASQVIITAGPPNTGLFVYNGTPALGNPPVFSVVAPGVTTDPFGNAVVNVMTVGNLAGAFTQITAAGAILMFNPSGAEVIAIDPVSQTFLFYNPSAALGNLVYSVSPGGSGTDAFGNAYLPGATSYKKITSADFQAYQTSSGGWNLWAATAAGGPWNLVFTTGLQADEVGYSLASNINSAQVVIGETAAALEITPSNAAMLITSGLSTFQGQVLIERATGALGGLLDVINDQAAPANPVILFRGQAAGDRLFGIDVVGDTNRRFTILPSGAHNWGSGSAGQDCTLYRASANLLASDYHAFDNGGAAESWNAVTFANGWANAGLEPGLQYRRVVAPDNCVQIVGAITVPVGFAAGQNITTALPAAYRPAKVNELTVYNANTNAPARITVTTGGVLQYQAGGNAAGNSLIIPAGNLVALTA